MDKLKEHFSSFLAKQDFDAIAFAKIDFKQKIYENFQVEKMGSLILDKEPTIFFDLASLSKPLTNGIGFLVEEKTITNEMNLVLNHKGGLPAWGLLPKNGWEEIINSFKIKESETLYSDYSALRFMLEFNKLHPEGLYKKASKYWDNGVKFWKDLNSKDRTVQNGFVKGRPNTACVHDPNAYNLNTFVSHAGLFGTIEGVSKTLLALDEKFGLINKMKNELSKKHTRFVNGWDTISDTSNTLAGNGCSELTFGHLGFTGTSIWIDSKYSIGYVLLSNATKSYWYDKKNLNEFRKDLGKYLWQQN
jgi:hypothetical protein